jgi:hypothetical protein
MASTYPTSLDSFTNPSASSLLTSPSHAQQHSDINDAMEAVQTKLAIGNTVIGTYTAYTPIWDNGITVGNGTFSSAYARVNNLVHYYGTFTFGSTTSVTSNIWSLRVPINADPTFLRPFPGFVLGLYGSYDVSATLAQYGTVSFQSANSQVRFFNTSTVNPYPQLATLNATSPFTWATGDLVQWNFTYRAA